MFQIERQAPRTPRPVAEDLETYWQPQPAEAPKAPARPSPAQLAVELMYAYYTPERAS